MGRDVVQFPLYLPPELNRSLREAAKRTRRSLNAFILTLLEDAMQLEGYHLPSAKYAMTEQNLRRCELHAKVMKDFGTKWVCSGPPQHSEPK
jgi:hypothetical protein